MLRRKTWSVTHGKDGLQLWVEQEHVVYTVANAAVDRLLDVLGHPCCGKGPLGWFDGDRAQVFWFDVMNWPNRFSRLNRVCARLPISEEIAADLSADVTSLSYGRDGDTDTAVPAGPVAAPASG